MSSDTLSKRIDRRRFGVGLTTALGLAWQGGGLARAAVTPLPSLDEDTIVIDALASPTTWNVPFPKPGPLTPEQIDNIRKSGITAINVTVNKPEGFKETVREIGFWHQQIAAHPDDLMLVRSAADIARAKAERKLGLIFGFQGMDVIGEDLDLIDTFASLQVKIMQITYNNANPLGAGSSLPDSHGLTELGREAVARLNELGVLVDVAHGNAATARDAAAASNQPITISHTGARAIFDSQRNMPDDVLKTVADGGGVVGIYLMPFLGHDPVAASRALFMRHLRHALDVCGEDHVGIGSDQSITPVAITPEYMAIVRKVAAARQKAGIGAPGEADSPVTVPDLNSARRFGIIAEELRRANYPQRVVDKVVGGNFDRLFKTTWPA